MVEPHALDGAFNDVDTAPAVANRRDTPKSGGMIVEPVVVVI